MALACLSFAGNLKAKPEGFAPAKVLLEKAIEERAFPGCAVAVGTDKKLLWSAALGSFDYGKNEPVREDTIYDLASVTKVAGTTAVFMRLVALEKIKVSEPAGKYLPEFVAAATTPEETMRREQITIEHLLTHSAGLITWKPFYKTLNSYTELLEAIYKAPLDNEPGKVFRYSDPGMMLLGEIAARAGGKPLATLEQELVFQPLKMKDTLRNPPAALAKRIPPTERWPGREEFVHGVAHDENCRAGEGITGHAGLFSTTGDLAKLAQEILRGLDNRSALFPQKVVAEFVRPRKVGKDSVRGLGWGVSESKEADGKTTRVISHTGFTGTSMRIDLDRKLFVVLLTNRVHPTRDNDKIGRVRSRLAEAVIDAFDGAKAGK